MVQSGSEVCQLLTNISTIASLHLAKKIEKHLLSWIFVEILFGMLPFLVTVSRESYSRGSYIWNLLLKINVYWWPLLLGRGQQRVGGSELGHLIAVVHK